MESMADLGPAENFKYLYGQNSSLMNYPKISLTGDLGSGKSAVSKLLSEELKYPIVSTGHIQRAIADKYGMSTLELNEYTRTHPEIDDEIDGKVTELSQKSESIIFDSRLAWHFAPASFKVYLLVDTYVAAKRILGDVRTSEQYSDLEEARTKILARRKSEIERFKTYYKIDYGELRNFDLVVETTHATPEEVARCIIDCYRLWCGEKEFGHIWLSPRSLLPTRLVCCGISKESSILKVLLHDRHFLIMNDHSMVSRAIAAGEHLIQAAIIYEGFDELAPTLRKSFLTQWEEMNFIRFREYPEFYH